jgi:uncharacterized protein YndB with AHSA1/START domain
MHGPDGVNYENHTHYFEVEKYSKMVYDHGANANQPALFRVTVTFEEIKKNKTKMEMTMALATAEAAQQTAKFIKQANGNSTWDRLAEHVSETDKFFINRTFNAPLEKVFDVWTNPEHFSKWLPPTGFNMQFIRADMKPGGSTFYRMTSLDGAVTMYGKAFYKEIEKPHRVVYTQIFCDENENLSRHPMAPTWPAEMLTVVTFAAEGANSTRVTVEWQVYGDATAVERETFHTAKTGMSMGWTGSFDKLEDYLAKA